MSKANADQEEFWTSEVGARRVAHQDQMDRLASAVGARLLARAASRRGIPSRLIFFEAVRP